SGSPSKAFMLCYKAAWAEIEKPTSVLLKLADEYDQVADAGNTDAATKAFGQISADLTAISENSVSNPAVLWQYVTQLVGFANTLQKGYSQENRDKLHRAIDALMKLF